MDSHFSPSIYGQWVPLVSATPLTVLYSACTNYLNQEVPGLPRSMIWKSSLSNFQTFNLNILIFNSGSKTIILKLNLAQIHSKSFYINGEVCLKVGVQD